MEKQIKKKSILSILKKIISTKIILLIIIFSFVSIKSIEIDLNINDNDKPIYKKTDFENHNNIYKSKMFDFHESDLCENKWTTNCSSNYFYFENEKNNNTLFSIKILIIPDFEKIDNEKIYSTNISNSSSISKDDQYDKKEYVIINEITNNLDSIKSGYYLELKGKREYFFKYDEKDGKIHLQGILFFNLIDYIIILNKRTYKIKQFS